MKKEKFYLNKARFLNEMENHKGKVHPDIIHKGHHAKLDRQSDIAAILNVSRSTLGNWLNGTNNITEENAKELAKLFECNWEYLVGKQEYRTKQDYYKAVFHDPWNEAAERTRKAKENNEPWIDFEVRHTDTGNRELLVNCNKTSVSDLIADIAKSGGYGEIIEGLKRLSDKVRFD